MCGLSGDPKLKVGLLILILILMGYCVAAISDQSNVELHGMKMILHSNSFVFKLYDVCLAEIPRLWLEPEQPGDDEPFCTDSCDS